MKDIDKIVLVVVGVVITVITLIGLGFLMTHL